MYFRECGIEVVPVMQRQGGNDIVKRVIVGWDVLGAADPPRDIWGFGAGDIEHFLRGIDAGEVQAFGGQRHRVVACAAADVQVHAARMGVE